MKPQYSTQNGMLIDGNFWLVHPTTGEVWTDETINDFIDNYQAPDNGISLDDLKHAAVVKIKQQAADRISATDWQLQRAEDRVSQAELGGDSQLETLAQAENNLLDVLNAREAIRQASNDAEDQVRALDSAESIEAFSWES